MSILDTFTFLFESDASKLDKGLKDSEKKAEGLEKKVGAVDLAASKMGASFAGSIAALVGTALAAVSVGVLAHNVFEAAEAADKLNEATTRLGLNIETISAWGDLVTKNGGSVDSFVGSIENLNKALSMMEVTGKSRAAPFLKELGIDLDLAANKGKNALEFLPQIADAFATMDKQKSVAMGQKLGFDQATIMTLQAGRREVEALLAKEKELGVITQQQADIADAYGDQIDDTRHAFRSLWLTISEYVLPPLTALNALLQDGAVWARKHGDVFVGLMIAIGAAITTYALPAMLRLAATTLITFAPFILAAALVAGLAAAFALLYEDVMVFIEGGDSLIGQILNKWPIIGEVAKGITATFGTLWDVLKAVASFMLGMFAAPAEKFDAFVSKLAAGLRSIPGIGMVLEGASMGARALAEAGTPLAAQTSTSITNSAAGARNTSVKVDKIEVKTQATDATGISKAIGNSMESQMRQAVDNFDDGILG